MHKGLVGRGAGRGDMQTLLPLPSFPKHAGLAKQFFNSPPRVQLQALAVPCWVVEEDMTPLRHLRPRRVSGSSIDLLCRS
jgi:hypothetical protein